MRSSHLLPALDDSTLNLPTDPCGTSVYKAPGSDGPLLGIGLVKTPIINHITEAKPPPPDEDASALLPFVSFQLKAQEAELSSVPSTPELSSFLPLDGDPPTPHLASSSHQTQTIVIRIHFPLFKRSNSI